MTYLDFKDDTYVYEDQKTLDKLYIFCEKHLITRTFTGWQQLLTVRDLLQMLGFTIRDVDSSCVFEIYQIVSWYGNDIDQDNAKHIINCLQNEQQINN